MGQIRRVQQFKIGMLVAFGLLFVAGAIFVPKLGLSNSTPEATIQKITDDKFADEGKIKSVLSTDNKKVHYSPIYRLADPTNSIGIKWLENNIQSKTQIDIRVLEEDWSEWIRVEAKDLTETPDNQLSQMSSDFNKGQYVSEIIFTNKATKLQYRITLTAEKESPKFDLIKVYAIGQEEIPTWKEVLSNAIGSSQANSQVNVISRKGWGANESWTKNKKGKRKWPVKYTNPNKIIFHHDGNARNLLPKNKAEAIEWIQGIYYWHAKGLGWGDIGYNYIVDPWGNVYQGRRGHSGAIAGHTYGQNTNSIGICFLGNYNNGHKPSRVSLNNIAEFASDMAEKHNFGSKRIYGHKDFAGRPKGRNYTACPGKNLYKRKGYLRRQANKYNQTIEGKIPENTLITTDNSKKIYLYWKNQKRRILNTGAFHSRGYKKENVYTVNSAKLKTIPEGKLISYDNNIILEAKNNGKYYKSYASKKLAFLGRDVFRQRKYKPKQIIRVSRNLLKRIPDGKKIVYKNGTLLKAKDKGTIWVTIKGQRYYISNIKKFKRRGYKWHNIKRITFRKLKRVPYGGALFKTAQSGDKDVSKNKPSARGEKTSVVRVKNYYRYKNKKVKNGDLIRRAGKGTISYMVKGRARPVLSMDVLRQRKLNRKKVKKLPAKFYRQIPKSKLLVYRNGTLIGIKGTSRIWKIVKQQKKRFASKPVFKALGYKFKNIRWVRERKAKKIKTRGSIGLKIAKYVKITSNQRYWVKDQRNKKIIRLNRGETLNVGFRNGVYQIFIPGRKKVYTRNQYIRIHPTNNGIVKVKSYDSKYQLNRFRGLLEVRYSAKSKKLWAINLVRLEDYLKGMLEAGNNTDNYGNPLTYQKTMAIIARSYASYYRQRGGRHSGEPFHLKNSRYGNGNDQVYAGYGREFSNQNKAVNQTKGQVITHNNNIAITPYSHGGYVKESKSKCLRNNGKWLKNRKVCLRTLDSRQVWGGNIPGCRPAHDPYTDRHWKCGTRGNHCVGLSAQGTVGYASRGKGYQWILKHYYRGTKVKNKRYNPLMKVAIYGFRPR